MRRVESVFNYFAGKNKTNNFDKLVTSRHSGLSGILLFQYATKTADSGQAGMTDSEYYRTIIQEYNV